LAVKTASEVTYTVSGGALNSTHSLTTCVAAVCSEFVHELQSEQLLV